MSAFDAINPATGETVASYDANDAQVVEQRLDTAWRSFESWRTSSFDDRAKLLSALADELDHRRDELAELMTTEMGKTLVSAGAEVDKCAWACRHYAENGERYLTDDVIETDAAASYVRFDPLGPLLAIMPWNFPLWQLFRAAAPAIAAGNVVLLKHAANVPGCALAIEDVFRSAGAPEGTLQTLLIHSDVVAGVIADDRIRAVTLTGSVPAGRQVAAAAGEHLKPTVLELGGSDPYLILEDADIELAARVARDARLVNNGESCIAGKRFIAVDAVADDFVAAFRDELASATVGDPMEAATDVGPLARDDLRAELHDQVTRSVDAGAELVLGGEPIDGPGYFYEVTLLDRVSPAMAAGAEVTFGPAAAVLRVHDEDAAVATANDSDFGLGAGVISSDTDHAQVVAARIDSGAVFINRQVASDPRAPFGGVRHSGYGRELGGYGIKEFVNAKIVWVA